MLKHLSRLEKTRNFVLLAFVVLMAVSLIFFYAPRSESQQFLTRSQESLATVGNETVTVGEVALAQENLKRRYAQFGSTSYTPPLKSVVDGEISSRLIRQEAARLGLTPTDDEVRLEIQRQFKAADMNLNDIETYKRGVTENYGSVAAFEQQVRDQIAGEKLNAFLTSGVSVSEEEILDQFRRSNTSFDLVYVPVTAAGVAEKINPNDEQLQQYFEANKSRYYISTPQKKIRYLFINQSKVGEKLDIPEADLRAEYDQLPPDKKQKGVEVQQIVLKILSPDKESEVLTRATEIVTEARKNGTAVSEQDFATLARNRSEDPATAPNGGKVNGIVRENKAKPDDPYQQVLNFTPGQITDPIKQGNAYYIVRRGEAVPKSFEDAKEEILVSLRNRRAYRTAADLAQEAADKLKETKDVQKVAEELAARANMKPDEMVRETGLVKPGDDVPNIGVSPQFEEGIAPLESVGQVGERTQIKDGFAIPMLVEKRDPRDADFAEVRDRVLADFKLENGKTQIASVANNIAQNANSPEALKANAEKAGIKSFEAKDFKLGSPLGEGTNAATSNQIDEQVYSLKPGEVTKVPLLLGDNYYLIGVTKRTDPNMDEFAKQREDLMKSAIEQKKMQVFSDYLADLRRRYEEQGRIKIYKEAMAKIEEANAADPATQS
ncbi:MAG: SurA N-terminal domain-containing protein [Acidobacteriota bacterium]|nr:SurA N-terminal domain-containing protein [Acidobacteriota bacterium]